MDKILQKWGNSISEGQRQGDWSGPAFLRAFSSTCKVVTLLSSLEVSKISFSFSQNHREISSVKWLLLKKSWATDQAAEQQDGQLSPVLCSQYLWRCYIWLNTKPKFMKTDKYLEMSKHKRNSNTRDHPEKVWPWIPRRREFKKTVLHLLPLPKVKGVSFSWGLQWV